VRRLLLVLLLLAVLVAAGFLVWQRLDKSRFETALGHLPVTSLRASYTDWAAVTSAVSASETSALLEEAFDEDLTAASAVASTFVNLEESLGIGPSDVEWEMYGQARDGAVALLRLRDDVDVGALENRFSDLGYTPDDGVFVGSPELVLQLDAPLTPTQENLAVVESERILVMSDAADYVASTVETVTGDASSLTSVDGVSSLASAAGTPSVAMLWARDFACEDLAMSKADSSEASDGAVLVEEVGGVSPYAGLVVAQQRSTSLTVGFHYDSSDQASTDLQARADLASGEAPGQGGTFPERFRVDSATADDELVTLTLDPVDGPVLADLTQGPLLFASC
jgi:hypothetical protein